MADSLPMTLRVYRKLSCRDGAAGACADQAAAEAGQGGSGARRRAARHEPGCRGRTGRWSGFTAPASAKCWRRRPLIERLRALESPHPADLGHRDLGGDRRQAVSARHHPSISCRYDSPRYRRALSRSLAAVAGAVHRIRSVAEPDPVERGAASADGADQRPDVAALVSALAPAAAARSRRCSAGSMSASRNPRLDAERFSALGSRNVVTTGNLKLDVPAPPADRAKLERLMSVTRGRPIIVAASTHPGEEEILIERTGRSPDSFRRC